MQEIWRTFLQKLGSKLANEIKIPTKTFEVYLKKGDNLQSEYLLIINKLKEAFFSLHMNKISGHDKISFNVIKSCFRSLGKPLLHIFRLSLEGESFPDDLKTARVTQILRLVMKMTLVTIDQSLLYLVFSKYLRQSCIKDFNNLSQHNYFTKSSLVFSKLTQWKML